MLAGIKSFGSENFRILTQENNKKLNQNNKIKSGDIVMAAITSCTNTSNPSVMVAAGLVAKKAIEYGLEVKPWVKTSLERGSKVVSDYLKTCSNSFIGINNPDYVIFRSLEVSFL